MTIDGEEGSMSDLNDDYDADELAASADVERKAVREIPDAPVDASAQNGGSDA